MQVESSSANRSYTSAASSQRAARSRRQSGNAFIESVFTLIPTLAIFLMVIDISVVVFVKGIFVNACREGVRWAITYSSSYGGQSCSSQASCIKQVVQNSSLGFLSGTNSQYIVVNYYAPNNLSTPLTGPNPNAVPPIRFVNQTGNVIEVNVRNYPMNWMIPVPIFVPGQTSGVANPPLVLNATGADVLQGLPVGTTTPPPA